MNSKKQIPEAKSNFRIIFDFLKDFKEIIVIIGVLFAATVGVINYFVTRGECSKTICQTRTLIKLVSQQLAEKKMMDEINNIEMQLLTLQRIASPTQNDMLLLKSAKNSKNSNVKQYATMQEEVKDTQELVEQGKCIE